MIHGSTADPVFIKKIQLRIWTLRDEIESVLNEKLGTTINDLNIAPLISEYTAKDDAEVIAISEKTELSDDESAMADAIEGGGEKPEAPDDTASEGNAENPESETDNNLIKIFQRTPNIPEEKLFHGKAILAEINMDEMYFFSNQNFLAGQSIVLEFVVPKRFVANAVVNFCRNYNMKSRIISPSRLAYRVGIKFTFLKKGERTLLRQFISSIEPDVNLQKTQEETPSTGQEDDSFDELDDLDL